MVSYTPEIEEKSLSIAETSNMSPGNIILVSNTRSGLLLGIDGVSLTINEEGQFHGFRAVPAGAHIVYAGSGSMSGRSGFWLIARPKTALHDQVHVMCWDARTETLEEGPSDSSLENANAIPVADRLLTYQSLASRPANHTSHAANSQLVTTRQDTSDAQNLSERASSSGLWSLLTSCVSAPMLNRIMGHKSNSWKVTSNDDYRSQASRDAPQERPDLQHFNARDKVLSFLFSQTATTYSKDVSGRQRTEQALDTTTYIKDIIESRCSDNNGDEVVGELQFTFLTGMLLGNIACMEQWGWTVKLLFRAFSLTVTQPELLRKVIDTFKTQMMYNESAFESSILDADPSLEKELRLILITFKTRLHEYLSMRADSATSEQKSVSKAFQDLENYLQGIGWDLRGNYVRSGQIQLEDGEFVEAELGDFEAEDERGEYAPVVVEIDDMGREAGILRWDQ